MNKLALYAPVTGRQTGQINAQWDENELVMNFLPGTTNEVELLGGGDIVLQAGGDVTKLFVHADKGTIDVTAGGSIGDPSTDSGIYLLLADTQANVSAGGDMYLQGMGNSTLQPLSSHQQSKLESLGLPLQPNWFWTLTEASALNMNSVGGDVSLRNALSNTFSLNDYPASLSLLAMDGDISLAATTLFSSSVGQLSLLAQNNITTTAGATVEMLGYSADSFAGWQNPVVNQSTVSQWLSDLAVNAPDNVLHINDNVPVRIVAREGDIAPLNVTTPLTFK